MKRFNELLEKRRNLTSKIMIKRFIEKLETLRLYFVSDSVQDDCEHKWVKLSSHRWCEKCNKVSEHYR